MQRRLQHDSIIGDINWIPFEVGKPKCYTTHKKDTKFPPADSFAPSWSSAIILFCWPPASGGFPRFAWRWQPSHNSAVGPCCRSWCCCWRRHIISPPPQGVAAPLPLQQWSKHSSFLKPIIFWSMELMDDERSRPFHQKANLCKPESRSDKKGPYFRKEEVIICFWYWTQRDQSSQQGNRITI